MQPSAGTSNYSASHYLGNGMVRFGVGPVIGLMVGAAIAGRDRASTRADSSC
jgi:hypothetical protein